MKFCTILSSLLVSLLSARVYAEKYNVVALPSEYGGTTLGLVLDDGTPIAMNSSVNGMYWSVDAKKPSNEYYYVILNQSSIMSSEKMEFNFSRKWESGKSATLNQVFGRKYDKAGKLLKTIPRISPPLEGYEKFSKLFQEGEVPVLRFHLSDQDFMKLKQDKGENIETKYIGNLDLFTPDEVFQFTNAELQLAGMGTRGYQKHPYKISLSENDSDPKSNKEIYDRSTFKLRNMIYDASYIKNKLVTDIMNSMGLPVAQSTHARFYINDSPMGLYDFSDVIKRKFVRTYFHPGEKKDNVKYGTLYKGCSMTGNMYLHAFLYSDYQEYHTELYKPAKNIIRDGAQPLDDIEELITWLEGLTPTTPEADIRKKMDVDTFLKSMALEYLACQWDGYLQGGNNYYVYRNLNGYFTIFSFDYDLSFGKWCEVNYNTFEEFCVPKRQYGEKGIVYSQLYNKILSREPFKSQMKKVLDDTVSKLFNVQALGDRINYLKEFLSDDIMWDIIVRKKIPTSSYDDIDEEEPIPTYEGVMALYGPGEQTIDDYGVYNWIKDMSERVATQDQVKFDINTNQGEVGNLVVKKKNGKNSSSGGKDDDDAKSAGIATKISINGILLVILTFTYFTLF